MWYAAFIISLFPASPRRRRGKTAVIKTEGVPPGKIGSAWNTTEKHGGDFFRAVFMKLPHKRESRAPWRTCPQTARFSIHFSLANSLRACILMCV
ncbi:hypothetical protein HMPREF1326_02932 [Akkermansia sp. KLE1605]|nr:hypothetical protein HMPREF1326_02932 [Akkermansia sp. KLE1605]